MVGAMTDQPPLEPDIEVPTHDEAAAIDLEPESRRWRAWVRSIAPQQVATFVLVTVSTVFVAWNVQPDLWFDNTTPTGGDMGAHVWSPAYLRDVLLPEFRLTGWSPDWYAGFPAFTFYMVIPSLLIVMVNVGLGGPFWVPVLAAGALGTSLVLARNRIGTTPARDATLVAVAAVGFIVIVPVDYGAAMKLIVVAGMVTLPIAAWSMGKLGGLAFPGPGLMAVATIPFLFDRSFNIYGGNLLSTMAGEFANSLGLTFAVVFFGVAARAWRPVVIGELLPLCLRLPDSPISSLPSSRSCVCWRCGSSGRVCARPPGSLSSAHWPPALGVLGAPVLLEPVVAQRHGLGQGAPVRRRTLGPQWFIR